MCICRHFQRAKFFLDPLMHAFKRLFIFRLPYIVGWKIRKYCLFRGRVSCETCPHRYPGPDSLVNISGPASSARSRASPWLDFPFSPKSISQILISGSFVRFSSFRSLSSKFPIDKRERRWWNRRRYTRRCWPTFRCSRFSLSALPSSF